MDARRILAAALVSGLAACAGPGPAYPATARPALLDDAVGPETAEARAEAVLGSIDLDCAPPEECPRDVSEVPFYFPEADVTETERRSLEAQDQEVRSLGIIARWEPGRSVEIERGNGLSYRGDLQSDP